MKESLQDQMLAIRVRLSIMETQLGILTRFTGLEEVQKMIDQRSEEIEHWVDNHFKPEDQE